MADNYIPLAEEAGKQVTAKVGKEGNRSKAASDILKAGVPIGSVAIPASQTIDVAPAIEFLANVGAKALPYLGPLLMSGDTREDAEEIDKDIAFKEREARQDRFSGKPPLGSKPPRKTPRIPPSLIPIVGAAATNKEKIQQIAEPVIESVQPVAQTLVEKVEPVVEAVAPNMSIRQDVAQAVQQSPAMQEITKDMIRDLEATKRVLDYQVTYSGNRLINQATTAARNTLDGYGFNTSNAKHPYDVQNLLEQAIQRLKGSLKL